MTTEIKRACNILNGAVTTMPPAVLADQMQKHLTKEAAPFAAALDMLDALKDLLTEIAGGSDGRGTYDDWCAAVAKCKAAYAKARGEG